MWPERDLNHSGEKPNVSYPLGYGSPLTICMKYQILFPGKNKKNI